jgi:hypothetical protein
MAGCPEDNLGWRVGMRDEWGCGTDGAFTDFEKSKPASSVAADLTTQLPSGSAKSLEILPSLKTIPKLELAPNVFHNFIFSL